jgi:HD-like signal output (HDOD) protein
MADTLSNWIKVFSDCEIPVLHKSKHQIYELQKDEQDITITVLTDIARQDPGFSIALLRHAGRSKKKEITTLSHAISLISIPLVIKMLSDLPELEKVLDKSMVCRILNNYSHQYQIAFMAKEWSVMRKESENNEIFTAGLNRGFVRFLMYFIDPDIAIELEKIYTTPDHDHKLKEKELLGNNVDDIAQAIAKNWNLPELIRESYSGKHHNPKITGIRLATELIHKIYSQHSIHYAEELTNRIAEYIRKNENQTAAKINWIIINAIRNSQQYLPYQPLLKMMMCCPSSIKKETTVKNANNKSNDTILLACIKALRSDNTSKSTGKLIEVAIKAMKEGVGFSRVCFMAFDTSEKSLQVNMQSVDNDLPSLKHLKISIGLNKLFNQLLKKEQILCINSKNQYKFSGLLPQTLRPMKPIATIIVSSFYVNKKVIGCFFVDHGHTDKQLTIKDRQLFQSICTELKAAIESIIIKNKSAKKVA